MNERFEMPVRSIFSMRDREMVLAGVVRKGLVAMGDRLTVTSPRAAKVTTAAGLERLGTRELLMSARERPRGRRFP
jgi:translation elongation factor EF-Tu-like GTPase